MTFKFDLSSDHEISYDNFNIQLQETQTPENPNINYGYNQQINQFRNQIDKIKNEDWKKVRWLINEYDFLVKDPIINRAFYKYWEIINEFDIFDNYDLSDIILHCAEAPGGFIQGTNIYLQIDRNTDTEVESHKKEVDEDGFTLVKRKNNKKKINNEFYYLNISHKV